MKAKPCPECAAEKAIRVVSDWFFYMRRAEGFPQCIREKFVRRFADEIAAMAIFVSDHARDEAKKHDWAFCSDHQTITDDAA